MNPCSVLHAPEVYLIVHFVLLRTLSIQFIELSFLLIPQGSECTTTGVPNEEILWKEKKGWWHRWSHKMPMK